MVDIERVSLVLGDGWCTGPRAAVGDPVGHEVAHVRVEGCVAAPRDVRVNERCRAGPVLEAVVGDDDLRDEGEPLGSGQDIVVGG